LPVTRLRVPVGYLTGALVLVLARPTLLSTALGSLLAISGEALRVWASGHIEKTRVLATGGPYAHTRNPLYLGSVLMALGIVVVAASPWIVPLAGLYLLAFYPRAIREEATFLAQKFPLEYEAWARAVPLFLPRLLPAGPRASSFSWSRIRANREWRTALALPLLAVVLYVRARWLPWG
jgi:protein-S-isoprenylcysteine O-methyltransferase Ste14